MPTKVFLDANVYFSAARSIKGGSSFIVELAKKKSLKVFATSQVLKEAEKNLRLKEDFRVLLRHYENIKTINPKIIKIDKDKAKRKFGKVINKKDALVLAGTRESKVDFLVTLDKKHFFTSKIKQAKLPFKIVTPGGLIEELTRIHGLPVTG